MCVWSTAKRVGEPKAEDRAGGPWLTVVCRRACLVSEGDTESGYQRDVKAAGEPDETLGDVFDILDVTGEPRPAVEGRAVYRDGTRRPQRAAIARGDTHREVHDAGSRTAGRAKSSEGRHAEIPGPREHRQGHGDAATIGEPRFVLVWIVAADTAAHLKSPAGGRPGAREPVSSDVFRGAVVHRGGDAG